MNPEAPFGSLHPFRDRAIRFLLRNPDHLRALVRLCHPQLADALDFDRLVRIERSFILDDYREREADLVVRLPCNFAGAEREILIYILLEHQSSIDAWMPFRLLMSMMRISDEQRQGGATGPGQLNLVVPIVLYTGVAEWDPGLDFRSLIDAPAGLLRFAPQFDILFLGLAGTAPETLEAVAPLGWALRAIQRAEAARPEFGPLLRRIVQHAEPFLGGGWRDVVEFLVALIVYRRPASEVEELMGIIRTGVGDALSKRELDQMQKSMAEAVYEDALERGRREGIERGRLEGAGLERDESNRSWILRVGRMRFGQPPPHCLETIKGITDSAHLESLARDIFTAGSWSDLLGARESSSP